MITKSEIKQKVSSNPAWATRAIEVLFEYQTSSEQEYELTEERNGVGFNAVDAEILSSFAKQILQGRKLTYKQLTIAYKALPKYAGQLLRIAETKGA